MKFLQVRDVFKKCNLQGCARVSKRLSLKCVAYRTVRDKKCSEGVQNVQKIRRKE